MTACASLVGLRTVAIDRARGARKPPPPGLDHAPIPPSAALAARVTLAHHGWATRRGSCLDLERLVVLADAAVRFHP